MLSTLFPWLVVALSAHAAAACNPLTTNGCPPVPGLPTSSYSIDFTREKSLPKDWILADASDISFGSKGIEFNFRKRKDAPYIWTNFYVAYGRIDVEMQVARGTGVITSAVMFSDDNDEIDWEFSGSNFGAGSENGKVQTNCFGKGITGNYDRGTLHELSPPPQSAFHTYTINWTPEKIEWILDGVTKYTEKNNGLRTGNYQFPQTPSRLHLGVWDAGDQDTPEGTRHWAGGLTDYSKCPYVAYVKTVKISTPYPCKAWKYPDNFGGSWADVQCTNETLPSSALASPTSSSAKPKSTEASYAVVAGDNGYSIADKLGCTFDQLAAVNPGVKWDFLDIGQKLNNPGFTTQTMVSTSSGSTTSGPVSSNTSATRVTSTAPITTSPVCSSDECYNSMVATQFITSAISFCSSYNKTSGLGILPIPTYLNGCNGNTTKVKSACSCLSNVQSTITSDSTRISIPSVSQVSSTSSLWSSFWSSPTTSTTTPSTITTTSTITKTVSTTKSTSSSKTTTTTKTSSTTKTTSKTSKTTSTKTTTTSRKGWNAWSGSNGGRGWGGWKRSERSNHHVNNHRFGRIVDGRQHA